MAIHCVLDNFCLWFQMHSLLQYLEKLLCACPSGFPHPLVSS